MSMFFVSLTYHTTTTAIDLWTLVLSSHDIGVMSGGSALIPHGLTIVENCDLTGVQVIDFIKGALRGRIVV